MKHLDPRAAWQEIQAQPHALFLDVRMEIECMYVGRPPLVVNIAWYEYPELTPDAAQFVAAVSRETSSKDQPIYLICRSGKRSLEAGKALEAAGYSQVHNIVHGFEGELDAQFHRSTLNGWRHAGLPWEQM